ncbi:hypothetical protein HIM_00108 [Hirsutella minnesotensis 3608]|nr:hypothetical protein HIM_00108 [Hirsutella minnesotensis 3608]
MASPGGPLQAATPERVNQRGDTAMSGPRPDSRDNSVHEKISQFNNLSVAMQSKQLERKTADAALKRAMIGREEAEAEVRRLKEELRQVQKAVNDGKERERKVGERLETVMENYGRAKETHAHTQALWEKEIRRARKENFKTQSIIVKLQEELKSARSAVKILEESVEREKERTKARENEAFSARYQLVGVQEKLDEALERIKVVEQERDAFKTAAKNEEVARIAAEGRIPLPKIEDPTDEFASPKKKPSTIKYQSDTNGRLSLTTMELVSSAASEMEIEELTTQVLWERQRANRAQEMIDFLQAECQMHCCPCAKARQARKSSSPPQKRRHESIECPAATEALIEEREAKRSSQPAASPDHIQAPKPEPRPVKSKKEPRRSTIFLPREGIFRTISQLDADAMEEEAMMLEPRPTTETQSDVEVQVPRQVDDEANARLFTRSPSLEPPAFALPGPKRTSLESLLHAPHKDCYAAPLPTSRSVPTIPDEAPVVPVVPVVPTVDEELSRGPSRASLETRPHTSATLYTVTTVVPVRDENAQSNSSFGEKLRTPSSGSNVSFDYTNPALTPTMTREQALAKIRERRGRVRSAQAAATPRKLSKVANRRDMSAPTGKTIARSRS